MRIQKMSFDSFDHMQRLENSKNIKKSVHLKIPNIFLYNLISYENRKRTEYIIHFSIICFKDKGVFHNKQKFLE